MKHQKFLQQMIALTLVALFLVACSTLLPPSDGAVSGTLKPWGKDDPIADRQIVLCQIVGEMQERHADCVLMGEAVASDDLGRFQFSEIPPGAYFILHDSGLSDFGSGLERWRGKTLKLTDWDWILDEYCGHVERDDITAYSLDGMSLMRPNLEALVRSLFVCDSPFVLALKPDSSHATPLVVKVIKGQTVEVEFKVGHLSNDD